MNMLLAIMLIFTGAQGVAKEETNNKEQKPAPEGCVHTESQFNCVKYIKNYDGDTITFLIPGVHPLLGHDIPIRLRSVDTPEMKTKDECEKELAVKAQQLVEQELSNAKSIELRNVARGKYFRIVADIHYDGRDLAKYLVKQKLAAPEYFGGTKPQINWCDFSK